MKVGREQPGKKLQEREPSLLPAEEGISTPLPLAGLSAFLERPSRVQRGLMGAVWKLGDPRILVTGERAWKVETRPRLLAWKVGFVSVLKELFHCYHWILL